MRKPIIVLIFIVLALFLIHPVDNNDIWMHLRSGKDIIERMQVQRIDEYSYTMQGRQWLNHQWLSQVIYYLFFFLFGVNGLIGLQFILVFFAFVLLFRLIYRKEIWRFCVFLILLVILFSQDRFLVRPLVFSHFFFALFIFILHRFKYNWTGKKENLLYLLILFQALWVNLHGAAIMGIFFVWSYIIGEFIDAHFRKGFKDGFIIRNNKYKKLLYTGIFIILVSGLTPYGYRLITFPVTEIKHMYFIEEWLPTIYKNTLLNFGTMPYYRLFLIISIVAFILRGRLISSSHIVIFSGLLYLSLSAKRHLLLFGFTVAPCIVEYLRDVELLRMRKIFMKAGSAALVLFLIFLAGDIFTGKYYTRMSITRRFGWGRAGYPDEAINFLIDSGLGGNIFNDYGSGCYLIWRFYPQRKVFLDGRNTIYGTKFIEDYIKSLKYPILFEGLVKRFDINYVFLEYSVSNTEDFIGYLYKSPNWALVYLDDKACIFVRDTQRNSGIINKHRVDLNKKREVAPLKRYSWQSIYPNDYINRALFYEKLGLLDNAIQTLLDTTKVTPDIVDIYYNLGCLYLKKQNWEGAVGQFKKALAINKKDVDAYNNLGIAYIKLKRYEEAIEQFKKALWLEPFHLQARRNIRMAKTEYKGSVR